MRIVRGRVKITKREGERERERNMEKYEKGPKIEREINERCSPLNMLGLLSL